MSSPGRVHGGQVRPTLGTGAGTGSVAGEGGPWGRLFVPTPWPWWGLLRTWTGHSVFWISLVRLSSQALQTLIQFLPSSRVGLLDGVLSSGSTCLQLAGLSYRQGWGRAAAGCSVDPSGPGGQVQTQPHLMGRDHRVGIVIFSSCSWSGNYPLTGYGKVRGQGVTVP